MEDEGTMKKCEECDGDGSVEDIREGATAVAL